MNSRWELVAVISIGVLICTANVQARKRPAVSDEAADAAQDIGAALRGLRGYQVDLKGSTRASIGGGNYRDFDGDVHYVVRPPDRLTARIAGKGLNRQVFYDGQTITVFAPAQMKYARVEAPGDIATLREQLKARKGLELPVADLFAWGTPGDPMSSPSKGTYAGTALIAGQPCRHYSYRQAAIAWEVWADEADLPCKLVLVDEADPGLPGYVAEFTWHTTAPADDVFVFTPPAGATLVDISQISGTDTAP
ncbi:MAG TPA: DUF2092 domain-containing protein [Lysobacter sp.]